MNNRWKSNWIGYQTIARREIKRFFRIWMQTLLPPAITTVLYFLIFGKVIGDRVGVIEGISYIDFIAPGLVMMSVITNAYNNVSSSFFGTRFHRNIDEQLVSPLPDLLIVLGYVTGGVLRGLVVGVVVAVVSFFFTDITIAHWLLVFVVAVLSASVFAILGFLNALFARSFDDISIIPTFILTPLTYLGGVFYSIQMLGEVWQIIAQFNPLLYVIDGFRYAVLGQSDMPYQYTIIVLTIMIFVLLFLAVRFMKSSLGVRT